MAPQHVAERRARQQRIHAPLGAAVELLAAATLADRLSAEVDFFSIGTNNLTPLGLGLDGPAANTAPAHHTAAVLRLIAETAGAAHAAGVLVDVCGEAASDPIALPLLIELGR